MPQINQLSEIFFSQLFWLLVVFGIIYFVIGRGMVPKIQATVDAREQRIAGDLAAAQDARAAADETEAAWRARMDSARGDAARIAQDARAASARDIEQRVKAAADKINSKIDSAQDQIRAAVASARAEIESIATDAALDMVSRLTDIVVDKNDAAVAVKAELNV